MMRVYKLSPVLIDGTRLPASSAAHISDESDLKEVLEEMLEQKNMLVSIPTENIHHIESEFIPHLSYLPENQSEQDEIDNCECDECKEKKFDFLNNLKVLSESIPNDYDEDKSEDVQEIIDEMAAEVESLKNSLALREDQISEYEKKIKKLEKQIKKLSK